MTELPFGKLFNKIIDNRGKTCPTALSGTPLIATNCIKNDQLYPIFEKVRFVEDDTMKNWFRGHPKPGNILFVTKGTPGRVAWVPNPVNFCIAQDMLSLDVNEKLIYPKYLFAVLRSNIVQGEIENLHVGSLIPHFKKGDFDRLIIPIPERPLQKYIGDSYFDFCLKIDLLQRNNKTLEEMAETLFRQWFIEEAGESNLSNEFNVTMGQSPPGDSYNEIGDGIIFYQGRTDFGFRFPTPRIYCTHPTRFAETYDTLISVRAPVGDINYAAEKCCIGRGVASIRHKNKDLHHSYTYYLMKHLRSDFDLHEDTGTIFGSINKEELLNIKCPKIDESQISYFNLSIGSLDDKIVLNCKQIQQLETLRDTLLPKLMSGQIICSK